jgi:hypothetical protein
MSSVNIVELGTEVRMKLPDGVQREWFVLTILQGVSTQTDVIRQEDWSPFL